MGELVPILDKDRTLVLVLKDTVEPIVKKKLMIASINPVLMVALAR